MRQKSRARAMPGARVILNKLFKCTQSTNPRFAMVRVDFNQIENCDNYSSVPNGSYPCYVGEVRSRRGDDGAERWSVRWIVADGPYAGRTAAWDSLGFSGPGLRRTKLILQRLAVPVDGPQEIEPSIVEGRRALVTVYAQERIDAVSGRKVIANRVPFAGIEALPETDTPTAWTQNEPAALESNSPQPASGELDDDLAF